jgi:hypothetical protein
MSIPQQRSRPINPLRSVLRRITCITLCCLSTSVAFAQSSGGTFTITKQVIASGGEVQGAPYAAVVTMGQAVAGMQSGGTFQLIGGFHAPAVAPPPTDDAVFKDSFEL